MDDSENSHFSKFYPFLSGKIPKHNKDVTYAKSIHLIRKDNHLKRLFSMYPKKIYNFLRVRIISLKADFL